ncbi:Cro/C1-type HTH domain protein [Halorhabdus tiamatea SARL4B]|uniref:Putative HTH-type transcriptional regulatory protein HLRTI_000348 n=1 Tax=Halorhabdus tiamatea SARL4B TaxID=1033806 RepID=F7PK62_9EURY|nr:transcriptional regulator [Halorhabdus tiamatea]ERJ07595.1 Cro/C1-type HTH domain protein [Halorhabdus tiamatea SARL4B]CCQ33455.1 transcriptional regulator, XRE family [Halorhabdus tiamatea SARL4B]
MSRSALVGNVIAMLEDAGFLVSDRCAIRPKSFDVAARRGEDTILVKILGNIDAFDGVTGAEMRRLGEYLNATPLVIGLRTRDEELKPGVVYFRHGVPVFSPDTAMDYFLEGVPPLIYAAPGGLYVNIDSDVLADAREERDWSLGKLANELGVSRRTVSKYENGMDASVEVAAALDDLFEEPLTSPVNVLEEGEDVREDDSMPEEPEVDPDDERIVTVLTRVGFDVHPTNRAPFKTVSENEGVEDRVFTGHSELNEAARKRARIMASVGRVTRTRSVYVVERATRDSLEGTALVEESEMDDIEVAEDLRELIRERGEEPA